MKKIQCLQFFFIYIIDSSISDSKAVTQAVRAGKPRAFEMTDAPHLSGMSLKVLSN